MVAHFQPCRRVTERGALMTEMVVAMALLLMAMLPLAYSFAQEQEYLRSCYQRAIAAEIVDGELEVLLAGEWRAFHEGGQEYLPKGGAMKNLPAGRFELTMTNRQVRLAWLPAAKGHGGGVVREAMRP